MVGAAAFVGELSVSQPLEGDSLVGGQNVGALVAVAVLWTIVLAADFVLSFSYTLWPRKAWWPRKA